MNDDKDNGQQDEMDMWGREDSPVLPRYLLFASFFPLFSAGPTEYVWSRRRIATVRQAMGSGLTLLKRLTTDDVDAPAVRRVGSRWFKL